MYFSQTGFLELPLVCFWLLFWDSSPAAPSLCLCPSLLDAHSERKALTFPQAVLTHFAGESKIAYVTIKSRTDVQTSVGRRSWLASSLLLFIRHLFPKRHQKPLENRRGKAAFVYLDSGSSSVIVNLFPLMAHTN